MGINMKFENGVEMGEVLGSKWNLLIICSLREETLRFTELQKRLGDVNSKTVTDHLRVLERYHVINRVVFAEVPPRVEYSLTEHGRAVLPVFEAMLAWGASLPAPREK
jgi:DNA-binding HxlR family transcriptional regulator